MATLEERLVAQIVNIDEKETQHRMKYRNTGDLEVLADMNYCAGWVRGLQQALQYLRDGES